MVHRRHVPCPRCGSPCKAGFEGFGADVRRVWTCPRCGPAVAPRLDAGSVPQRIEIVAQQPVPARASAPPSMWSRVLLAASLAAVASRAWCQGCGRELGLQGGKFPVHSVVERSAHGRRWTGNARAEPCAFSGSRPDIGPRGLDGFTAYNVHRPPISRRVGA